jgi:hypothetical protein
MWKCQACGHLNKKGYCGQCGAKRRMRLYGLYWEDGGLGPLAIGLSIFVGPFAREPFVGWGQRSLAQLSATLLSVFVFWVIGRTLVKK